MKKNNIVLSAVLMAMSLAGQANANTFNFNFSGPGVSGSVQLTYGAATDSRYSHAYEITGVSGLFSDSNNGLNIVNASINSLVAVTHDTPEPSNFLAPNDFSRFPVTTGLLHGSLSYDNLFWLGGSPQTASDYPFHGGFLDIYGLLFNIDGGKVVDLWSNGDFSGTGKAPIDYGVAVVDQAQAYDYVEGRVGVAAPDSGPGAMALGTCLLGMLALKRSSRKLV